MKIHEYQAKAILSKYGVAVPRGQMVGSREEAEAAAKALLHDGATGIVVKAQIHAGGRGKGGGVKLAKSAEEASELAGKILGMNLVTHQTGPEGKKVQRLLIEETLPIARELYLGIVLDRGPGRLVFMASAAGGMEIEEVAAKDPNAIIKEHLVPGFGLQAFQAREIAFKLGLDAKYIIGAVKFIKELRDLSEEDPLEVEASKYQLNYIKLDGNVGCMVNGAGLAMATMDIIQYAGGMPANFLDVGGGANEEQVTHAFEILLSDKNVKAVLINIFGGILRVDTLANGIVSAARKTNIQLPIVLRLEGTNVEQGRKTLQESGLKFIVAETMKDAAERVVAAAKGVR